MVKRAGCWSGSHRHLKDRARARLDDLQAMMFGLQSARKDGRATDAAAMEEQAQQILQDWKDELGAASPAPSGLGDGVLLVVGEGQVSSDLSLDIHRLLQLCDEEGEATSKLSEFPPADPKPEPLEALDSDLQGYLLSQEFQGPDFIGDGQYKITSSMGLHHACMNSIGGSSFGAYQQSNMHQEFNHNVPLVFGTSDQHGVDLMTQIPGLIPAICPPPSAFLRPKCALWDCPRPAHGSEWWQDYCSIFHTTLAFNEGPPGMSPVLRPGGIDLKDGPLFAALSAKTQGKNVGIPECEGAATTKSPWNAPELFDLLVLDGESLREWLFFDKPRKAFESGSRKQRSLPDYNGRGWHESRKQVMKEFGGLKRSYYMDPQPLRHYEWHLYEYEISNYDACALYRLELKLVEPKKSIKGKITSDPLTDLQQQMGRLNAEIPVESKQCLKAKVKVNRKDATENVDRKENTPLDQMTSIAKRLVYEQSPPFDHSGDS